MTTLSEAASEEIRKADDRLRDLAARQRHLAQERASAVLRRDLNRVAGLDRALTLLANETAHVKAQRARWVNTLISGRHPVRVAR